MGNNWNHVRIGIGLALFVLGACAAWASDEWEPVDDARLEEARGGFALNGGLLVSLGVERIVTVNGQLAAHTHFNVADLGAMSPGEAQLAHAALSGASLLQVGPGNYFHGGLPSSALGGLVIQNTLSDQVIGNRTIISASVNSLGLLNAMRLVSTIDQALANALPTN